MSQLTIDLALDNYKSTLSQSYNGGAGSIYVNTVPDVTFPTGKKVLLTIEPEKDNMQVVELDGRNSTTKTLNCTGATVKRGEGATYSATTHGIGSLVKISIPYDARDDIKTAVNTKVNTNSTDTDTGKFADATARDAYFTSPVNGNSAYLTAEGKRTDYVGGAWVDRATGSTPNASTTVAGKVEKATSGEVTAGTATGGTGAELFVGPAELKTVTDGVKADIIISAYFGNGSDGDVTISSGTTTLTRDMYYNNLTITSPGVLDPAGYRIFVKGTLSGTGTIRRNGNNGTAGGTRPTGNNPGVAGAVLNQGSLNMEVAGGNGGARSTGAANSGASGASSSPSMTNINGVAGGNNGSGGGAGSAGTATRGSLYNVYGYPQSMHLATASTTFAGLQYLSIPGSGGGAGSAGSGGSNQGAGGGAGGNGGFIWLACYTFNFTGTVSATGGTGGAGGTSAGGGGGGNGGIFFRVYHTLSNDCTKTLTGGAGGAGGAAGLLPAGVAGTAGNAGETITITI